MVLTKITGMLAYEEIKKRLEHSSLDNNLLNKLNIIQQTEFIYMDTIESPTDIDILRQVIGRKGCYFIKTTKLCNIDFIWHDREQQLIEFWGPMDNIQQAKDQINIRITKITDKKNNYNSSTNNTN